MILIEVDIPGLNEGYDFSVDETVPIADIIAEISQLISQKWQILLSVRFLPESSAGIYTV